MRLGHYRAHEWARPVEDFEEDRLEGAGAKLHLADLVDHDEISFVQGARDGLNPDRFKSLEVNAVPPDPRRPRTSQMGQDPFATAGARAPGRGGSRIRAEEGKGPSQVMTFWASKTMRREVLPTATIVPDASM